MSPFKVLSIFAIIKERLSNGRDIVEKIELIICDLDGTLVDSETVYRQGWSLVLKEFGHEVDVTELDIMRGKSESFNNNFIKSYLGSTEFVENARLKRENYYFDALESGEVNLMEGALELLQLIENRGIKLGVATSSNYKRGTATLKKLNLYDFFTHKVFGDQVTHSKPHPEIYNKVLESAGVSSENAIAIEDSPSGLKAALGAGLKVYFVSEIDVDIDGIEGDFEIYSSLVEVQKELFE